jgi:hypothetical protein
MFENLKSMATNGQHYYNVTDIVMPPELFTLLDSCQDVSDDYIGNEGEAEYASCPVFTDGDIEV